MCGRAHASDHTSRAGACIAREGHGQVDGDHRATGRVARAKLSLRLVPINRQVAWDIVNGRCGDEGRPVAAAAAFRQILSRNDGSGEGIATVPVLEPGKPYYVRVFSPGSVPADRGGFGCANLSEVP